MAGWHHWLDGCESEWTPGFGDGQGSLVCCNSWGLKESDMTEWLKRTELNARQRWADFQKALALTLQEIDMEGEKADLHRAIKRSMQGISSNTMSRYSTDLSFTSYFRRAMEEMRSLLWKVAAVAAATRSTRTAYTSMWKAEHKFRSTYQWSRWFYEWRRHASGSCDDVFRNC